MESYVHVFTGVVGASIVFIGPLAGLPVDILPPIYLRTRTVQIYNFIIYRQSFHLLSTYVFIFRIIF